MVAGVVIGPDGRVLIQQRPAGRHLAGGWEFPGGKLEAGEDRRAGLARELREELGIVIATPRPLMRLGHSYPYGEVLLDVWVVRQYQGTPQGLDGQALRWCTQVELEAASELLPADRPVVRALRLPETLTELDTRDYAITRFPAAQCDKGDHPGVCRGLLDPWRLRGLLCDSAVQAMTAGQATATAGQTDFLVISRDPTRAQTEEVCAVSAMPVYVTGYDLHEAWSIGATGVHQLFA